MALTAYTLGKKEPKSEENSEQLWIILWLIVFFLISRSAWVAVVLLGATDSPRDQNPMVREVDPLPGILENLYLNMGLFRSPDRSCWESGTRPEALYLQ